MTTDKKEDLAEAPEESTYCAFKVGKKEFYLPVELVKEVIEASAIFPIPGAPEYLCGVVPVRGRIIPAIDLSKIYLIDNAAYKSVKLIVVNVENEDIGFMSESLPNFMSLDSNAPATNVLDAKTFFETYRVKEQSHGKV